MIRRSLNFYFFFGSNSSDFVTVDIRKPASDISIWESWNEWSKITDSEEESSANVDLFILADDLSNCVLDDNFIKLDFVKLTSLITSFRNNNLLYNGQVSTYIHSSPEDPDLGWLFKTFLCRRPNVDHQLANFFYTSGPDKGMVKFFPIKTQVKFLSSTLEYIFKPLFHKPVKFYHFD